eukprot:Trichotokara_eunicae@DN404_c0_g1_i1.p1
MWDLLGGDGKQVEQMIASVKKSNSGEVKRIADTMRADGNAKYKAAEYNKAIELYTQAYLLQNDDAVLLNRAAAHIGLGQWDLAKEDANSVLKTDGSNAKAHFRLASALEGTGLFTLARR